MNETILQLNCPLPITDYPQILLAHGGGGTLMHELLDKMILPTLQGVAGGLPGSTLSLPEAPHDAALLILGNGRVAMTTDSFVVQPLFFPGGDIGELAVYGTVNDLAMSGALPLYLSVGLILEEGLPMETLWRVLQSMRRAADSVNVRIVTGDTKVVQRGKGDGIFINTAGIGLVPDGVHIHAQRIQPGDSILVNGDLGRHGLAIMIQREGLRMESALTSDAAPLHELVHSLLNNGIEVHCLRDLTRGGLSSALNEIAQGSGLTLQISEADIPISSAVRSACELLGLDPLQVACEGRCVAFIPADQADAALACWQQHPLGRPARRIGTVLQNPTSRTPRVHLRTPFGVERVLDMLSGEQLPRIC
ncbi:MAG: Carbamoyl dehydratase HypE [Phycisphaerae bacterium]|nr:Carbamoyl dehydratase HypE [Phycisphaerae bacterium]